MTMINIARNCGSLFVGLSLLMQLLLRFVPISFSQKEELAKAAREANGAGIFFMIASWCFAMLARQSAGSALVLQRMGLIYSGAFAFWCLAFLLRETDPAQRQLYGSLRKTCLGYAVSYCVLSYLLV